MRTRSLLTRAALASAVVVGILAVPSTAFAGGAKVPFTDPNQVGSLTLCNRQGQPVTSGSLLTIPFVWRAVSSARAPAGYDRATLDVFQPIQYVEPGDWTGYQLTDDAIFSNPAHPMAQATYADAPLIWPDQAMPPYWDGLYQLRMVFSAPNKTPWNSTYPAAVIKVAGNTWTLLQGGRSSCTGGTAESMASLVLPKSETATPRSPATVVPYADRRAKDSKAGSSSGGPTTTVAGAGGGAPVSGAAAAGAGSGSPSAAGAALSGAANRGGGSSVVEVIVGVGIAALLFAGATLLVVRRRRRAV